MIVSESRVIALELLNQVSFKDAYANLAIQPLIRKSKLNQRDKAFCQELAFGTIRYQLTYDQIIDAVATRKSSEIDLELHNCLRLGAHQLLQMRVPDHAAISETVELVRKSCGEKVVGFANGVLRSISRKSLEQWLSVLTESKSVDEVLSVKYSHPVWIINAYRAALMADGLENQLEILLSSNNTPAEVNLVALPGQIGMPAETATLRRNRYSPYGFSIQSGNPSDLDGFDGGLIRVQDEGSQLAALSLALFEPPSKGERWLDMCAGPGGKAAILAAIAKGHGVDFEANEPLKQRAELVESALAPIGQFKVHNKDGQDFGKEHPDTYDRVLVDAPCTGLGALRRRPEARWRKSNKDLKDLCKLQFALLQSAIDSLKPGGLCLYVTCSPHLSETTAIIHKASQHLNIEILDLSEFLNTNYFHGALPSNRKTVQLFTHRDGTDSMFLALLRKPTKQ